MVYVWLIMSTLAMEVPDHAGVIAVLSLANHLAPPPPRNQVTACSATSIVSSSINTWYSPTRSETNEEDNQRVIVAWAVGTSGLSCNQSHISKPANVVDEQRRLFLGV
jgi:hypothetical protein